jgi:hypothetical protein
MTARRWAAGWLIVAACGPRAAPEGRALSERHDAPALAVETLATDAVFERTGGLAGFDDHLRISRDGAVTGSTRGATVSDTIPPEQLTELALLLKESGLFTEDVTKRSEGFDITTYTVRYHGAIVSVQGDLMPTEFGPVLSFFLRLLPD